jgi:uncharacterized protein YndB with AHSA1/START domain
MAQPPSDLAPVTGEVTVSCGPSEAFARFLDLGDWWPLAYTFSEERFQDGSIEPRSGGRWFERDQAGETKPWGTVRAFEPDRRLVLSFAIGADRKPIPEDQASEVELQFGLDGANTLVKLEHRDFERHGEGARVLREGMSSPQGWPLILAEFRRACRRQK